MLFYSYRIIIWEQHDWKNPPLVTRAHQTLDKARHFCLDHRPPFRSDSQSYRSGCRKRTVTSTTDRVEATMQATTAKQP